MLVIYRITHTFLCCKYSGLIIAFISVSVHLRIPCKRVSCIGKDMDNENCADAVDAENDKTLLDKYLTFSIAKDEYGIEITYVTEIIGIQEITELPDTAHYVQGVINLRGKVITVIDVRLRMGFDPIDYNDRTCIVVVNVMQESIGLIVDSVSEVMDIPPDMIDVQADSSQRSSRFVRAFGKVHENVVILLDIGSLLFDVALNDLIPDESK